MESEKGKEMGFPLEPPEMQDSKSELILSHGVCANLL